MSSLAILLKKCTSGIMMPAMKGLDLANLRANLRKTPQSDSTRDVKKVCISLACVYNILCT